MRNTLFLFSALFMIAAQYMLHFVFEESSPVTNLMIVISLLLLVVATVLAGYLYASGWNFKRATIYAADGMLVYRKKKPNDWTAEYEFNCVQYRFLTIKHITKTHTHTIIDGDIDVYDESEYSKRIVRKVHVVKIPNIFTNMNFIDNYV
jgi:hypothetical protein